jgi:hypothetical protein
MLSAHGKGQPHALRCSGVIWFVFSCSPSSMGRTLHLRICVALASLWQSINRCQIEFHNSSNLFYGYWEGLFVDFSTEYSSLNQLCSLLSVGAISKILRCSLISFRHLSIRCLFFDPHVTTHHSNVGVRLRKVAEQHPHTVEWVLEHSYGGVLITLTYSWQLSSSI